jgi:hypothetical protein
MEFVIRCSMERSIGAETRFQSAKARGIRRAVRGLKFSRRVTCPHHPRIRVDAEQHVRIGAVFDGRFAQLAEGRNEAVPRRRPAGFSKTAARAVGNAQNAGIGKESQRDRDSIDDTSRSTRFGSQHVRLRVVWGVVRIEDRRANRSNVYARWVVSARDACWARADGVRGLRRDALNAVSRYRGVGCTQTTGARRHSEKTDTVDRAVHRTGRPLRVQSLRASRFGCLRVLVQEYVYVVAVNKHCAFLWTSGVYALRSTDCRMDTLAYKSGMPRRSPG